jgi:molybdopterin molybdotransferase
VRERIGLDEARACVLDTLRALAKPGIETLPLSSAPLTSISRYLARDIASEFDLPRWDNSAVDGFAVRLADIPSSARARGDVFHLPLQGKNLAGETRVLELRPGYCCVVATGARIPSGADAVLMKENQLPNDDPADIRFRMAAKEFGHNWIRKAGEDFAAGTVVLPAGQRLDAFVLAALHALGKTTVEVCKTPTVSVLAYGSELQPPGTPLSESGLYDCNRIGLSRLLQAAGCAARTVDLFADDRAQLKQALQVAVDASDAVVIAGGASVGEADFSFAVLQELGEIVFYRVQSKPGMPVIFALIKNRAEQTIPVFALPGNPVSAMISLLTIAKPGLQMLAGGKPSELIALPVPIAHDWRKSHPRREFVRAQLRIQAGKTSVVVLPAQSSAQLSGLLQSTGLIDLPEGEQQLACGDIVRYLPFSGLLDSP